MSMQAATDRTEGQAFNPGEKLSAMKMNQIHSVLQRQIDNLIARLEAVEKKLSADNPATE
jgi:hypothetical protein